MAKKEKEQKKEIENNAGIADRKTAFKKLHLQLNSKYEKGKVSGIAGFGTNFKAFDCERIPTGIFGLDYSLGGGIPIGHKTKFFGHKSSGKTTTMLRVIANAQKMGMLCAYADPEGTLDLKWAKLLGVNLEDLLLIESETAEGYMDMMCDVLDSGNVDLLAIDSLAALMPNEEMNKTFSENSMALRARLVGRLMNKLTVLQSRWSRKGVNITVIFTNQLRQKPGIMFGDPYVETAGVSHTFATTCEVRMWATEKAEIDDDTKKPLTQEFNFRVTKNKSYPAKMSGTYLQVCSAMKGMKMGEIYDEEVIRKWAVDFGILIKDGGKYQIGDNTITNVEDLDDFLLENPKELEKLKKRTLEHMVKL
jgi:recombination protein RecA